MYIYTSTMNCSLSAGSVATVYRRREGEASGESAWTVGDAQDRAGLGVRRGKITWHYTDVEYLLNILIYVHF